MGIFKRNPDKKAARKAAKEIRKHMKKNGIGQSDGLVYNEKSGQVEYDSSNDSRSGSPIPPRGTPPYNPYP